MDARVSHLQLLSSESNYSSRKILGSISRRCGQCTRLSSISPLADDRYQNVIGTIDTDLTAFRMSGGKILSWQGLADQLVPPNGAAQYYSQASLDNSNVDDFYRLFFAPGTRHCEAGSGPYPHDSLDVLVEWVKLETNLAMAARIVALLASFPTQARGPCRKDS